MRRADPAALQTLTGEAMGTTWSVRLHPPGFLPLDEARQAIEAALALVVRQMSNWEADSDISRFNRAEAGSWHVLPAEFFTVLTCAFDWAQASGGAWDPTDLWGLDAALAADVLTVLGLIARRQNYPDTHGYGDEFRALVAQWRPHLMDDEG